MINLVFAVAPLISLQRPHMAPNTAMEQHFCTDEVTKQSTQVTSSLLFFPTPTNDHIFEQMKWVLWLSSPTWRITEMIQLSTLVPWKLGWPSSSRAKRVNVQQTWRLWSEQIPGYQSRSRRRGRVPHWIFSSPSHILPEHVHPKCVPEFTL